MPRYGHLAKKAGFFAKGVAFSIATASTATATVAIGALAAALMLASPTLIVLPLLVLVGGMTAALSQLTFYTGTNTVQNFKLLKN